MLSAAIICLWNILIIYATWIVRLSFIKEKREGKSYHELNRTETGFVLYDLTWGGCCRMSKILISNKQIYFLNREEMC